MHRNRSILALALTVLVGACAPVTTYTDAEAPKHLKLDSATTQLDLHFAPGSAALSAGDAARLRQLAATGRIDPSDRVSVAVNGSTRLAQARAGAVAATLLTYGIVPVTDYGDAPPNGAVVAITRTLVTLPRCPNWSKPSYSDFGNQPSSNFGCADETNLGMMVARPTDLASGLSVSGAPGHPAAAAVNRYMNDKVQLPAANTALPIATQSPGAQGPGSNPNSPGGS
ncbi:MAG TPA: CpaD family pilus assembly lipoprotein [Stellaceae bacterium]|jgi:pilus assembly protein CpaD|nr:CpaD family pilus assembly lipoprotein [Stellaceae bacterium]